MPPCKENPYFPSKGWEEDDGGDFGTPASPRTGASVRKTNHCKRCAAGVRDRFSIRDADSFTLCLLCGREPSGRLPACVRAAESRTSEPGSGRGVLEDLVGGPSSQCSGSGTSSAFRSLYLPLASCSWGGLLIAGDNTG